MPVVGPPHANPMIPHKMIPPSYTVSAPDGLRFDHGFWTVSAAGTAMPRGYRARLPALPVSHAIVPAKRWCRVVPPSAHRNRGRGRRLACLPVHARTRRGITE